MRECILKFIAFIPFSVGHKTRSPRTFLVYILSFATCAQQLMNNSQHFAFRHLVYINYFGNIVGGLSLGQH